MKPARIIVLVIALAAGGIAAFLASRSDSPPPAQAPVAQIETVDVLVAGNDIGLGSTVQGAHLRWQIWPKDSVSPFFIRKDERPDALNQVGGSIARQRGRVPPPHSSVNMTFLPSLLNVAECQ